MILALVACGLLGLGVMLGGLLASAGRSSAPRLCAACGERPTTGYYALCRECLIEEGEREEATP